MRLQEFHLRRCSRRSLLKTTLLALLAWRVLAGQQARAAAGYPETLAALERAYQREMEAHRRYLESASKAKAEGYNGVAYLFTAFAASELIHAQNFERVAVSLGGNFQTNAVYIPLSGTKQNLITAANDEIDTIDKLYPETLKHLEPEGHSEAIAYVKYALASEKQHREIIERVQRYTDSFFDRVVKAIDEMTSHYYVCQVCGFTVKQMPTRNCAICNSPSSNYRKIAAPV
jgi:rubrerythrin